MVKPSLTQSQKHNPISNIEVAPQNLTLPRDSKFDFDYQSNYCFYPFDSLMKVEIEVKVKLFS
jgi:hypothetical protein